MAALPTLVYTSPINRPADSVTKAMVCLVVTFSALRKKKNRNQKLTVGLVSCRIPFRGSTADLERR